MSWIWCGIILASVIYGCISGNGEALTGAALEGAGTAVELTISIGGAMCLWCGVMELMERAGALDVLSRLLKPLVIRLFPSAGGSAALRKTLSANIAANMLGLGNAATPLGLKAISMLDKGGGRATDEMCALVVLNTASIQLIPATVAAVRAAAGSSSPFDILPAVWLTSAVSVAAGLAAAALMKRWWPE